MYKQDLPLNNLQGLICHKTQSIKQMYESAIGEHLLNINACQVTYSEEFFLSFIFVLITFVIKTMFLILQLILP